MSLALKTILALVLVSLLGSSFAGCANDKPPAREQARSTDERPTALTHAQFVTRLNRLCRAGNRRASSYRQRIDQTDDPRLEAALIEESIKAQTPFTAGVRALKSPAEDRAAFKRYTRSLNRQDGLGLRMADALRAADGGTVVELASMLAENKTRRVTAAIDLGADDCGR